MKYSFIFIIILSHSIVSCQSSKRTVQANGPSSIFSPAPSSRNPNSSYAETEAPKKSTKAFGKSSFTQRLDQKIEEYEERMERNKKKYRKRARMMKKPQYSDLSYFGHKKKPKKRPVGKRKLCKECGIVH